MKYIKTFESIFKKSYVLDDLFKDIDENKIEIFTNTILYEKDNIVYIIRKTEHSGGTEFGPSNSFYFYINDKYTKTDRSKLIKLYNILLNKYKSYKEDINKYNL
jgi:hypothetical protein